MRRRRPRTRRGRRARASGAPQRLPAARRPPRHAGRRRAVAGTSPRTSTACAAARSAVRATGTATPAGTLRSGDARKADGGAEVEERLGARSVERLARPLLDPAHVRVDREDVAPEGEVSDRRSGVGPDAGQFGQVVRPPVRRDVGCSPVQADRPPVVAQPLPLDDRLGGRGCGQRLDGRPPLEPPLVPGDHPLDLGLLQHHLADEDRVGIPCVPPGEVTAVSGVPRDSAPFSPARVWGGGVRGTGAPCA